MLILLIMLFCTVMFISKLISIFLNMLYKMKINTLLENINSKEDLLYLSFKDFLNLMAEVFKRKGYKVRITDKCGEDGKGLILNDIQLVDIWKHGLSHIVDVEIAMKLAKCMQLDGFYRGMLLTLGDFKQSTKLFCHRNVIECISGEQLVIMCKEVQKRKEVLQTG
jgi:restriction system protein